MLFPKHKISEKHIQLLLQQLADLLQAGIDLSRALILLKAHNNHAQILLNEIQQHIQSGLSLSETLNRYPQHFSHSVLSLIRCGENSGRLSESLTQVAHYQKIKINFKRSCWHSCAYPAFVLLASLSVFCAIMLWIVPLFAALFAESHQDLPLLTQFLIELSLSFTDYALFFLLSLFTSFYCYRLIFLGCFQLRWRLSEMSAQIPILNDFVRLLQLNPWLDLMANYLQAGMHFFVALEASNSIFNDLHYQARYQRLIKNLAAGHELAYSLKAAQIFPAYLLSWILVGEQTGNLVKVFQEAHVYYQQEMQKKLQRITQFIEPIGLLLISSLIGMLVIALYLPIFKMGEIL